MTTAQSNNSNASTQSDALASMPAKRKALYERIISDDAATRTNWRDVIAEFVIENPKGVNKEVKGVCAEQFAVLYVSKRAPSAVPGSKEYKECRKNGQTHFASCANRTLREAGYMEPTTRSRGNSKATSVPTATASAQGATDAAKAVDAKFGQVAGMLAELASRVGGIQTALVAFQRDNQLTKKAREGIGSIAGDVTTLATKVGELSEFMISGTTAEQAANDLAAKLAALVTPPVPTTMQESAQEPATA